MATLNVPCFRYLGQDLTAPLTVEDGTGDQFVRCPVRERLFRVTPEERVRQALIWFLLEGSNHAAALGEHLRFGVEERSLDVAGFFADSVLDERFQPSVTVAILETKRQEEELIDHSGQLQTYMQRDRCRSGLLFNSRQAVWMTLGGDFATPQWTAEILSDLREAEERLEQASHAANAHLGHCRSLFTAAAVGNFDSLVQLASLFCEDPSLTFALSIRARGSLGLVQACGLRVESLNLLSYRTRGVTSRKRQEISRDGFHALISVRPLWS